MTYKIKAGVPLQIGENDILQNVAVILATQKGSVPMYRDFGIDSTFIDRPVPVAKVLATAEIKEAIGKWEPRAKVEKVSFEDPAPGHLIPIVEVSIDG